ncbi:MAG: hypothetical protein WA771_12230 [Chthoniobacterales bacterium]
MRTRFALALALVALAFPILAPAEPISEVIGDRKATEIRRIIPAETPEAQRLPELSYIAGYEILGDPEILTTEQTATLEALTAKPDAFESDGEATCKLRPGVALRFGSESDAIDMLVCFACNEVAAVPLDRTITQLALMPQSSRDVLLGIAKAALPEDEAIQELPEVRREGAAPAPYAPPAAE